MRACIPFDADGGLRQPRTHFLKLAQEPKSDTVMTGITNE